MLKLKYQNSGLSLIELVVVVAIFGILAAAIFSLSGFRNTKILETTVDEAASLISEARSKTISSENALEYGVHFEPSRMVLFSGTVFTEPNVNNKETILSPLVEISSISLNGGANLIFQRITGKTGNYGAVVFRVKSNTSLTKTISVKSTGLVDIQ